MICGICESKVPGRSFHCTECDQPVCKNCRDENSGLCDDCIEQDKRYWEHQEEMDNELLEAEEGDGP